MGITPGRVQHSLAPVHHMLPICPNSNPPFQVCPFESVRDLWRCLPFTVLFQKNRTFKEAEVISVWVIPLKKMAILLAFFFHLLCKGPKPTPLSDQVGIVAHIIPLFLGMIPIHEFV